MGEQCTGGLLGQITKPSTLAFLGQVIIEFMRNQLALDHVALFPPFSPVSPPQSLSTMACLP